MTDITIVTHSSRFHADDVFAVATLRLLLDDGRTGIDVVRSREVEDIERGDYVVDVGGVYDPNEKRFDHHQSECTEAHEEDIPMASFGLVWREYGEKLCGSKEGADIVRKKLVLPMDAIDNGVKLYDERFENVYPYDFGDVVQAFMATWKEAGIESNFHYDNAFNEVVMDIATPILEREIMHARAIAEGIPEVERLYEEAEDKRIIVMENNYPHGYVLPKYPEPLYVVRSNPQDDTWSIRAVRNNPRSFDNRKNMPGAWAGLRDEELAAVTGVKDAVFCHRNLFMAVAKSKEGALKLAQIAAEA